MVAERGIFCNFASKFESYQKIIVKFIEVKKIALIAKGILLLKFDKFYRYEEERREIFV